MARFTNDGSTDDPKLRVYLNWHSLVDLRVDTVWPNLEGTAALLRLAEHGFEGAQRIEDNAPPVNSPIPLCGCDRVNTPAEADAIAAKHTARGYTCLTVHAGWGLEDEAEVNRLVDAILTASDKYALPIFLETHRATITQDLWRTVQIARKFPEVLFNGDFSHYYTGQEMVYGDLGMKLDFMEPIFSRIGFLHARISTPGCMQVPIDEAVAQLGQTRGLANYMEHHRELWIRGMKGFLRAAKRGDYLIFAPELVSGTYYYARTMVDASGNLIEETDRYQQALLYQKMARECFAEARRRP